MDTIGDFIWLNIWVLVGLAVIGALIGTIAGKAGSLFTSLMVFWWGVGISFWVWVIYAAIHFIAKYW